jgi:Mn-containing catalase
VAFYHVKELEFNARVSGPDPRFASLLLEQFGGANGELSAAMQYFTQSFAAQQPHPDKYDMLMDIATEELSHLEIVGATITMLLEGVNGELKNAAQRSDLMRLLQGKAEKEQIIQAATISPLTKVVTGGGPGLVNSEGVPWTSAYIHANGDLTVDLRSDIGAEARAKIVYEYLLQFTDDSFVQESLRFLMTREIAHMQMFQAALDTIQPNFPPGILQGDPRFTHAYVNLSNGASVRGPWNQGQGPWGPGQQWDYIDDPLKAIIQSKGLTQAPRPPGTPSEQDVGRMNQELGKRRSDEYFQKVPLGFNQWSDYPQTTVDSPQTAPGTATSQPNPTRSSGSDR